MNPGLPAAAAYNPQPLQATLQAQSIAASAMAIYVIGGGALTAAALVSAAYSDMLQNNLPLLPTVTVACVLMWGLLGGAIMHRLQARAKLCNQAYEDYLQQRAQALYRITGWQKVRRLLDSEQAPAIATPCYYLPVSLFGAQLSAAAQQLQPL